MTMAHSSVLLVGEVGASFISLACWMNVIQKNRILLLTYDPLFTELLENALLHRDGEAMSDEKDKYLCMYRYMYVCMYV
jgi:hypothetical protein